MVTFITCLFEFLYIFYTLIFIVSLSKLNLAYIFIINKLGFIWLNLFFLTCFVFVKVFFSITFDFFQLLFDLISFHYWPISVAGFFSLSFLIFCCFHNHSILEDCFLIICFAFSAVLTQACFLFHSFLDFFIFFLANFHSLNCSMVNMESLLLPFARFRLPA